MAEVFALVLPFFGMILIGYIAARIVRLPEEALGWFNVFIIYVALPALFFRLLADTPIEDLARFDFIAVNIAVTFAIFLAVFFVGRRLRGAPIEDATIQGLAGAYGNIGYMGPALAILAFGERAAVPVAIIVCFENILHFSVTPMLMAAGRGRDRRPLQLVVTITKRIAFHPFIISMVLGIAVAASGLTLPGSVSRLVEYLSQAAAPSALFVMGVTLALRPLKQRPVELGYIVPVKLIVHPLAMYVALSAAGDFPAIWVFTAVLLAALPTATNVFVLAQQYGVWIERASATVLITTAGSVVTVSALLLAITSGTLPPDLFP
jgi:malonate transporter and related proteins